MPIIGMFEFHTPKLPRIAHIILNQFCVTKLIEVTAIIKKVLFAVTA